MTMSKQLSMRNQRSKDFRVKHAIQIFVVIAVCIWMLYRVEKSYGEKVTSKENSMKVFLKVNGEQQMLRLGRKDLNPTLDELAAEFETRRDLDDEDRKLPDDKSDEAGNEDEEIDTSDQEKTEEAEHEQLEDLIDEDDKE